MALNSLKQVFEKRGLEYSSNFLSGNIIISEKLDTYRIIFENVAGRLRFFKQDNTEINLIERIITNLWEDAIIELSIILNEHTIPEGLRFGIAYTPIDKPIRIKYDSLPKYILTDITKIDESEKISFSHPEIERWAEELALGRPPIIFEGPLNKTQIIKLLDYSTGSYSDNFSLSKILEDDFKGTYSKESIIEGIIINNRNQIAQITSYEFDLLNENRDQENRDFYDLTILNLNNFLDNYNFPVLEGESSDDLYLEIACDIFNGYIKNPLLIENLAPEDLTPPKFGYGGELNTLLIKNKETLELLEKGGKIYESVFKIVLSSLRKYKKEYGLLNESDINKFNTYVFLISEKIKAPAINSITNSYDLSESRSENVVISAVNKKISNDVNNMRVISSIQKAFEAKGRDKEKGKIPCVVYFSEFSPFTSSQAENILSLQKMWKAPVIIAALSNKRRAEGKVFKFSDTTIKAQIKSFADDHKEEVPAYFMIDNWSIRGIFDHCRDEYEPICLITDKDKKSDFVLQLYFEEEIMGERIGVEKEFNIGEIENKDILTAFRSIEDNNFYNFKNLTPQSIWGLYDTIRSEYQTWGQNIKMI